MADHADAFPVYRIDEAGCIASVGQLLTAPHHEGSPWWLADLRPRAYLGRAYAARHAEGLGLPMNPNDWSDAQAVRALVTHGHDVVGNLLLGEPARERFLAADASMPIPVANQAAAYVELAARVARGEWPGAFLGGEQPKFTAFAETAEGPRHLLVKFSLRVQRAVARRWRDLLLAEHLALTVLREAGMAAARSAIVDHGEQRFLAVERFDRVGERGRRALASLGSLDDQFLGQCTKPWPEVVCGLADQGLVRAEAVGDAALLYAFGSLIGNTDMHGGNLSFLTDGERPYGLAPAYDMLPMGFAPSAGGALRDELPPLRLVSGVAPAHWRQALSLAHDYLQRLAAHGSWSPAFAPCLDALAERWLLADEQIERLGD